VTGVVARVKEEVRKLLVAAVFFAIGFCIIILHNRLLTEGSTIHIASYARAIVGGLIVAKVLLSVDMLPFVHAFPNKPLAQNITWKTSLYLVAGVGFLYTEPMLRHLLKGEGVHASRFAAWRELMQPQTGATLIWVAVLLIAFVTMQELSRVIGTEDLKRLFFGRRGKPARDTRFRGAA
jgi:hypothetical protein